MAVKIQLRRDTAANWNSNNPILAEGEIGVELDTNRMKVGDGSTHWNDLPYAFEDYYVKTGETVANADKVDNFDASQTPQANQIPVLNSSGQLWLPFAQTPILVNGQDMMHREFYVDAVNGDDNNNGSSSAPFATIKKACESVPVGGWGDIYLLSDVSLEWFLDIYNKHIYIRLNNYSFYVTTTPQSRLYRFGGAMCDLSFLGQGSIVFPTRTEDTSNIGDHPALLGSRSHGDNFKSLHLLDVEVIVNDEAYKLLEVNNNSTSAFSVYGTLTDNTGNNLTWADLLIGVVKDANGVPRNVISNIVL